MKGFLPMTGADGWQVSNFPILTGAAQLASLEIFEEAGMSNLRKKSILLTAYLEFLLTSLENCDQHFTIITPSHQNERGCQLSLLMKKNGKKVFEKITAAGVIADWREPNVIRVAPVPLYNTFEDVFQFYQLIKNAVR